MPESSKSSGYRAYVLDKADCIVKRIEIEADNDAAALQIAQQYVDGHDVELWTGPAFVRRLRHKK